MSDLQVHVHQTAMYDEGTFPPNTTPIHTNR